MNIKEVSEKTNLSDKTIRYYESLGLIKVSRKENGYREYSDENLNQLNLIRLLRYLSISLEEIQVILRNPEAWPALYEKTRETFEKTRQSDQRKAILFDVLSKQTYDQIVRDSKSLIEEIHDDALFEALEAIESPSLFSTIMQSFIMSGPILWLILSAFVELPWLDQRVLVPVALIATSWITWLWITYYRKRNTSIKRSNTFVSIILMILVIVAFLAVTFSMMVIQEKLFITEKSILYVSNSPYLQFILIIFVIAQAMTLLFGIRYHFKKDDDFKVQHDLWKFMKKYWGAFVLANLVYGYIFVTSVTVVNGDGSLNRFSPLNLQGTHVPANQITAITVGFTHGVFKHYKSEFKMILSTPDFSVDIGDSSFVNNHSDTYLEFEMLDALYRKLGIPKRVENDNIKNCTIDVYYCDRFMRIIENID